MNDGGTAFPTQPGAWAEQPSGDKEWAEGSPGMSLRAWLAGQALAGFCSTLTGQDLILAGEAAFPALGRMSVMAADSALAELAKGGA